jgi:hypothetical protein
MISKARSVLRKVYLIFNKAYLNNIQEKRLIALLLKSNISNILDIEENVLIPENERKPQFKKELVEQYKEM